MTELGSTPAAGINDASAQELSGLADRQGEKALRIADRIFSAALPGAVFGQPITSGNYTIITACEVTSGGGFGSGSGFGRSDQGPNATTGPSTDGGRPHQDSVGGGGGMGGGGGAMSRPVAVISIGPDGVIVRPVYDVTKVALAGLAALGTVLAILSRSSRIR